MITRRTVTKGVAWTAPIIAVGVAAPAFATSVAPPKPTMALCKIGCDKKNGQFTSWFLNFTFTFTSAVNTLTIPNNTILLDNVNHSVTVTKLSPTVWQVHTNQGVGVPDLSGTVAFSYQPNGLPLTPFSSAYNTAGHYCA